MLAELRLRPELIWLACECRGRSASEEYGGYRKRFPWLGILTAISRTSKRHPENPRRNYFAASISARLVNIR